MSAVPAPSSQSHAAPSGRASGRAELSQPSPTGNRLGELWSILPEESAVDDAGVLHLGGVPVTELADQYGTPLYVYDEAGLRRQIRRFIDGLSARWPASEVLFASKSFPAVGMYRIAAEEGLSVDIAGGGELQLALAAGVPPEKLHFHGNAKTDAELRMAIEVGVDTIIVDNTDELDRLERLLTQPQKLLLRVIPGVEAKTHASQATGGSDSKFGLPMDQALAAIERMRAHPLLEFEGVHLHIGSQILDVEQFGEAVSKISTAGEFDVYDVGGGLGVKYTYDEVAPSVDEYLDTIVAAARAHLPAGARIMIEPGRAIVARAGVTLYRVTTVKRTGRTFVAVDGGLADQMDAALTGQRFESLLGNRALDPWTETAQLVGRQCESGDLLVDRAPLPEARVGDLAVVATTGAYGYTLANNYNGALKPAIVFVRDGEARLVARRETYEELLALHAPALER
ncbi:diaminopimelate decarboxylase [Leucobacter chromiiresistens]|uniref:Diaminopimelate decarboxylase n=1 Tax=Leucobacter chromiiresistens TaxID=1079994 RepID=A0A1H0ZJY8_9MICO|nr:diaminopimelate decarboxylase [Leucobacter chromiiresistens]SDQ27805.1 diaminopimelate decarboxylase [Leucobacter chromiiresistens]